MWKEAINIHSEIVSVTSFNEWHEGSQIESAVKKEGYEDYGNDPDFYLKLTRKVRIQYFYQEIDDSKNVEQESMFDETNKF